MKQKLSYFINQQFYKQSVLKLLVYFQWPIKVKMYSIYFEQVFDSQSILN